MDPKPRPNHRLYIQTLRRMTPAQRLEKAFELSRMTRDLFLKGLRDRYPTLSESDFRRLVLKRLSKCHNRNY